VLLDKGEIRNPMGAVARKHTVKSMTTRLTPDTLLRRDATAAALTAEGYPTTTATLATKATRGGGPTFRSFGRVPLYRWGDAVAWAESRLSAPRRSTSEPEAQKTA
jgi:hypothetical protein